MLRYSFSIVLILLACQEIDINPDFVSYFNKFEREANAHSVNLKYRTFQMKFQADLTETKGCLAFSRSTYDDKLVVVDTDWWDKSDAQERELVIFHEFGHAFLCRGHEYSTGSIMMRTPNREMWKTNREELIDELFSQHCN